MSYSGTVLADSPTAYYRLDELSGTAMADSSGQNYGGTYYNSPVLGVASLVPTQADTCVGLSGSQYAEVPNGSWQSPTAMTVEAWVNLNSTSPSCHIVSHDNEGVTFTNRAWALVGASVFQFMVFSGGSVIQFNGTTSVVTGKTYHVVGVYDSIAGYAKLYVNGQLEATQSIPGAINSVGYGIRIGRSFYPASQINGKVDEVAIYSTALSPSQIATHYNVGMGIVPLANPGSQAAKPNQAVSLNMSASGGTPPYNWSATGLPAGLSIDPSNGAISGTVTTSAVNDVMVNVTDSAGASGHTEFAWAVSNNQYLLDVIGDQPSSHWELEETTGTLAADDIIGNRNGTIAGGVTLNQPACSVGSGLGMKFDGTSGVISFSNAGTLINAKSIETVISFSSIPASGAPAIFTNAYSNGQIIPLALGFNMDGSHTGQLQFGYYTGSSWQLVTWGTPPVGQPMHLVGTYDGTSLNFYVNNQLIATSKPSARPTNGSVSTSGYIARRWDLAQFVPATIWDMAVYPGTLSPSQVSTHFTDLALFFSDNFIAAPALTLPLQVGPLDTTLWTMESGEASDMSHTGWATFTPTTSGLYSFNTLGSDFDTLLGLYTGSSPAALTTVATDDNSGSAGTSYIAASLTAGTTYYIRVGAQPGGTGGNLYFCLTTAMAGSQNATFYLYENIGITLTPTQNSTAYDYENIGVTLTPTKDSTAYDYENIGITLTPTQNSTAYDYENITSKPNFVGWGNPQS